MRRIWTIISATALLHASVLLNGCQNANDIAKKIGAPTQATLELRTLQIRRFDTLDDDSIMAAATHTLQDLGYTITESSFDVGVLVASKQRDAEEAGEIAGQVMLTILFAAFGTYYEPKWDKEQSIHVTLVTTPIENSKQIEVRVSFDRNITNNHGHLWRADLIIDPVIYQQFFDILSTSVFLEAQRL